MSHSLSGIARGNIDIVGIEWISPNECESVGWFHHLTGPTKLNLLYLREAIESPSLESLITLVSVVRLPGLMILDTNDQHVEQIVVWVALNTNIVIGIERVPVERPRY